MRRIVVLLVAGLVLSACSSSGGTTKGSAKAPMKVQGGFGLTAALPDVKPGTPYIVYLGNVCVTGDALPLKGVSMVKPSGGIKMLDWGIRARSSGDAYSQGKKDIGAGPGVLSSLPGFTNGPAKVKCGGSGTSDEVDVNVKSTTALAVSNGFRLNYKQGDKTGSVFLDYTLALCSAHSCPDTYSHPAAAHSR